MQQKSHEKYDLVKPEPPVTIDSSKLFGSERRVQILHQDKLYQLTITRQNKLILTK